MANFWRRSSLVEEALRLPAGWRFDPTEAELIQFYLSKIVVREPLPIKVMEEMDAHHFYENHPRNLGMDFDSIIHLSYSESYIPLIILNSSQIDNMKLVGEGNIGSWRTVGREEEIFDEDRNVIAFKIHSIFFSPRSEVTNWRMELYRLPVSNNHEDSEKVHLWRKNSGWRFDPTDEELIQFYLSKIVSSEPLPAKFMKEIDAHEFYQHHPKNLVGPLTSKDQSSTRFLKRKKV
ncbi:hypothetical protein SASPL_154948 [Salvia splendens]|uniref:NAC domain-containing protein n=1 Tax=Salvia splendens TaxID=180675 RepID=A0A8X8W0Y6_SALSN|nr:hypothetical protein SASPL_154948 [Salvia splendens]